MRGTLDWTASFRPSSRVALTETLYLTVYTKYTNGRCGTMSPSEPSVARTSRRVRPSTVWAKPHRLKNGKSRLCSSVKPY